LLSGDISMAGTALGGLAGAVKSMGGGSGVVLGPGGLY
jgi:hypothetical protein